MLTDSQIVRRLERPAGRARVVLDTDTFNEIDDQYALSFMVKRPDLFDIRAFTAAPFSGNKAATPGEGMQKSYDEILNLLNLLGRNDLKPLVHAGSTRYLPDGQTPVDSPAAREIVRLAHEASEDTPLYVVAIGAITNVASALLIDPAIAGRVVVVWLGGHALHWPDTREFNLYQDVPAARVVLDAPVPLVLLPCAGVVSQLTVSMADLERYLKGHGPLCDYLADITLRESAAHNPLMCASRVIWDVATAAWFLGEDYCQSELRPAPIPTADGFWAQSATRHPIRYVYGVNRDKIITALFETLRG